MAKVTDKFLTLVNKTHQFDESMLDQFEMVEIEDSDGKTYIEKTTYEQLNKLFDYLKKHKNKNCKIISAGRPPELQASIRETTEKNVYNRQLASGKSEEKAAELAKAYVDKFVALPYQSEHHLGLCVDIDAYGNFSKFLMDFINNESFNDKYSKVRRKIGLKDRALKKVREVMGDYGFILRFPEGKEKETGYEKEDWHIRYVGVEHARIMNENDLTLEEYVAALEAGKTFPSQQPGA